MYSSNTNDSTYGKDEDIKITESKVKAFCYIDKRRGESLKKIYKILSIMLVVSLIFSNCLQVSAKSAKKEECVNRNAMSYKIEKNSSLDDRVVLDEGKLIRTGNVGVLYFVPGVGQVLITATGIVIVSGVVIATGSWLYKKVIKYYSEHTKNKRKSTHDKHTKPRPGRETEKKKNKSKGWQKRK